ncbi:MAG: minor capsid protein [Ruminococcus sp.]|nr:minor capsid protein [Ruminococcus sp.]
MFEKIILQRKLKKEPNYQSVQQRLASFQELGLEKYSFLGCDDNYDICTALNGKTFLIDDAELGVNLPPMHIGCRCTIVPYTNIDLFKDRESANPLKNNPKFEEWKKRWIQQHPNNP